MALPFRPALATALVLSMAGAGLHSQEADSKFGGGFKVRVGVDSGNLQKDTNANKLLGVGLSVSYALSKSSAVIGEITYTDFSSRTYPNPIVAPANPALSGDQRRNLLSGFSVRAGYRSAIGSTAWNWQAGLVLDMLKSRQEASGQLTVGSVVSATATESIAVTPEKTKLAPGAFVGVYTAISEDISLEFNILSVGYNKVNWVPKTYSGVAAAAESTNRNGLALECAVGFRF